MCRRQEPARVRCSNAATALCQPPLPAAAAGLGLRRALLNALLAAPRGDFDFIECTPENWIHVGGLDGERLRQLTSHHPLVCHGLSLSLGSTDPLDAVLLQHIGRFMRRHGAVLYSEHLSFCSDHGQLYDLLPMPFTEEAVRHVAARIAQTQDILGQRIAVENVSYYVTGLNDMTELEFTCAVLEEADCDLLLDVNNVHVNAHNHGYDAQQFIHALPAERIAYIHVAGHQDIPSGMKIDNHGDAVSTPVWDLLAASYAHAGVRATVLERDCNIPPYLELREEVLMIRQLQAQAARVRHD